VKEPTFFQLKIAKAIVDESAVIGLDEIDDSETYVLGVKYPASEEI